MSETPPVKDESPSEDEEESRRFEELGRMEESRRLEVEVGIPDWDEEGGLGGGARTRDDEEEGKDGRPPAVDRTLLVVVLAKGPA